jgi:sugar phosphate isomerase/epimerase
MARFLRTIADYAEGKNVEIWIETHNEFSTGAAMRPLLDSTGRRNVKVIWDLIHPFEQGETPEQTLAYLGDSVAHVHVKDGRKKRDPELIDFEYTKLGEGELPIREALRLLDGSGYRGYCSLEWENAWRPEIRGLYNSLDDLLVAWNEFLNSANKR